MRVARLNDVIQWIGMLPLKMAHAFAELSERHSFENLHDRVAHFFHDAPNPADVFVRAGTSFVELFADTTYRRQRAVNQSNDRGEANLIRREPKAVPT